MRALVWIVGLAALLWAGYWVVGSRALEAAAVQAFDDARASGRTAGYDRLAVRGFPSRFDLTVEAVTLADPASGYGWQAPFVQVLALSYRPWHVIAALPDSQTLHTPQGAIALTSAQLQASVVVTPGPDLALDRTALVGRSLTARTPDWTLAAAELRAATEADPSRANTHRIGLSLTGLAPDPALIAALAGTSPLPATVETLRLDASVTFDHPLNRHSTRLQATEITVKEALLVWGDLRATATGTLTADAAGRAQGRLDLRVENWPRLIPLLVASGALAADTAPTVEGLLAAYARSDPAATPGTLNVPLTFARGRTSLGPLPLGPAPRLR